MMKVHAFVRENITKVLAYKKGNSILLCHLAALNC